MRILFWLDPGAGTVGGQVVQGHIVQAESTASALRRRHGVETVVSNDQEMDLAGFDVIHAIGCTRVAMRRARLQHIPLAHSTIYWSADYVLGETPRHAPLRETRRRAERAARVTASIVRRGPGTTARRLVAPIYGRALDFECADLLLPNSHLEAAAIYADLQVTTPTFVVPNGVDDLRFQLPTEQTSRDYVLYVGRFEPHKNQLGLIKAMKGLDLDLVLVGPAHPHHPEYYKHCRQVAGKRVTFHLAKSHEELPSLFHGARVHVLPSYFETTGLVSLEAALSGCRIASTERGYASEYFADHAQYLNPSSRSSIERAVRRAWDAADDPHLRERVKMHFTWNSVADATIRAYQQLLEEAP